MHIEHFSVFYLLLRVGCAVYNSQLSSWSKVDRCALCERKEQQTTIKRFCTASYSYPKPPLNIHPSIAYTHLSVQWGLSHAIESRGRLWPRVARQPSTHTPEGISEKPINLSNMFLDCGRSIRKETYMLDEMLDVNFMLKKLRLGFKPIPFWLQENGATICPIMLPKPLNKQRVLVFGKHF